MFINYYKILFKNRGFRNITFSCAATHLSDWMLFPVIISYLIYYHNANENTLMLVGLIFGLPSLIIVFFINKIQEFSIKNILVFCMFFKFLTMLAITFLDNYSLVLLLIFIKNIFNAICVPFRYAIINTLVKESDLKQANIILQSNNQIIKIIGPSLGGLLLVNNKYCEIFLLLSIIHFISLLFAVSLPVISASIEKNKTPIQEMKALIKIWLFHNNFIKYSILFTSIYYFVLFSFDDYIVLINKALNFSDLDFSLLISCIGVGNLIGVFCMSKLKSNSINYLRYMNLGLMLTGIILVVICLLSSFNLINSLCYFLLWVIFGGCSIFICISNIMIIQLEAPRNFLCSVISISEAIQNGFMIISPLIGFLVIKYFDVMTLVFIMGCQLLIFSLVFYVVYTKTRLKHIPAANEH